MLKFSKQINSWNMMMLAPTATAAKYVKRTELGFMDGLHNFGTPILMVYLPLLLVSFALSGSFSLIFLPSIIAGLAFTVLWIFLFSFAFTSLSYGVGMFLGYNVRFGRLYYMVSLASAPTFVFTLAINIASVILKAIFATVWPLPDAFNTLSLAGDFVALTVTIYGLYLLTASLAALYKTGKARAITLWLVPFAILFGIAVMIFGAVIVVSAIGGALRFLL